jgi:hypothetical protein
METKKVRSFQLLEQALLHSKSLQLTQLALVQDQLLQLQLSQGLLSQVSLELTAEAIAETSVRLPVSSTEFSQALLHTLVLWQHHQVMVPGCLPQETEL